MREIDVLVVGAGPGGMSAAQYAARAGYSTLGLGSHGSWWTVVVHSTKSKTTRDWVR